MILTTSSNDDRELNAQAAIEEAEALKVLGLYIPDAVFALLPADVRQGLLTQKGVQNNGDSQNALAEHVEQSKKEEGRKKAKEAKENQDDTLDDLLMDPEYAQSYQDALNATQQAENTIDELEAEYNAMMADSNRAMTIIEASAVRDENGQMVFRSEVSVYWYTSSGQRLTEEEAQHLSPIPEAPSYEAYQEEMARIERLEQARAQIIEARRNVAETNERLHDHDRPYSEEELRQQTEEMNGVGVEIRRTLAATADADTFAGTEPRHNALAEELRP